MLDARSLCPDFPHALPTGAVFIPPGVWTGSSNLPYLVVEGTVARCHTEVGRILTSFFLGLSYQMWQEVGVSWLC